MKGSYTDVSFNPTTKEVKKDYLKLFSARYRKANHLHYVEIPKGGAISILFTFRPKQHWGFWVNNRILRPLKYFHKWGHPICDE